MKIAVEGCAHGELDKIYETIEYLEKQNNIKVDLLIICGDFQAVRNEGDLECMAVPKHYRMLNTFYKYYSGEKKAPILTLFIGGNHEASNYLSELPYGGWVCPNIFYLGYAGMVNIEGLRIGGLSGIYKGNDYLKGHFEYLPYSESTKRSVYHVRNIDVFKLKHLKQPIDIFISHDWPRGVYMYGDTEKLLKRKSYFAGEISNNKLGSRPAEDLLNKLQPKYWFAAHLHCKFSSLIPHEDSEGNKMYTKFLALDKCLPHRDFLQILDIGDMPISHPLKLSYDKEWLCILRSTNHLLSVSNNTVFMPGPGCTDRWDFTVTEGEIKELDDIFSGDYQIPQNFTPTAPPHNTMQTQTKLTLQAYINPQTTCLCKKLSITDPSIALQDKTSKNSNMKKFTFVEDLSVTNTSQPSINPDEIMLEENSEADDVDSSSDKEDQDSPNESLNISCESFFIDRTGSADCDAGLSPPRQQITLEDRQSLHYQYCSTPIPKQLSLSCSSDFPELKLCTENAIKSSDHADKISEGNSKGSEENLHTPPKKLKRRNQSIYMSNDEDN